MNDFRTMPGHLIRRAHQVSTAIFAEECSGFDLTAVQYAALSAIAANPGVDATRLSALIAFDRSTIGDVLERLEAKGWISREPGSRDRRIKLLQITGRGAALLRRVEPAVRRVPAAASAASPPRSPSRGRGSPSSCSRRRRNLVVTFHNHAPEPVVGEPCSEEEVLRGFEHVHPRARDIIRHGKD